MNLTRYQRQVLDLVRERPGVTVAELPGSPTGVSLVLTALFRAGVVTRERYRAPDAPIGSRGVYRYTAVDVEIDDTPGPVRDVRAVLPPSGAAVPYLVRRSGWSETTVTRALHRLGATYERQRRGTVWRVRT